MGYDVKKVDDHIVEDALFAFITGGLSCIFGGCSNPTYTVEFDNGETKQITAKDRDDLDRKIKEGKI